MDQRLNTPNTDSALSSSFAELGRESAALLDQAYNPERQEQQRRRLINSVHAKSGLFTTRRTLSSVALIGITLTVFYIIPPYSAEMGGVPLPTFSVAGVGHRGPTTLKSPEAQPLFVHFNEGSSFELMPETHGRISRVTADKVIVSVDDGQLQARINPSTPLAWRFDFGPYHVHVHGTLFDADWQPTEKMFALRVDTGEVSVEGPGIITTIRIRAGNSFISNGLQKPKNRHMQNPDSIETPEEDRAALRPKERVLTPTPIQPTALRALPPHKTKPPHTQRSSSRKLREQSWVQLSRAGKHPAAMAAIQSGDLHGIVLNASWPELVLLADSARYARRATIARLALEQLQERFPSSIGAKTAPFLLSRIALELTNEPEVAVRELRRYLSTQPEGVFAEEAQGRLSLALRRSGQTQAARKEARVYIERYPRGLFAAPLRTLVDPPENP